MYWRFDVLDARGIMPACSRYSPDIQAQGDCKHCGRRFEEHENVGLFRNLTEEQKQMALNFREYESFGPADFKLEKDN